MSWDAYFEGSSWNYTHNTNGMIAQAYEDACGEKTPQATGVLGPVIGPAWWKKLDGMTGFDGATYINDILSGLQANPDKFRAMNPTNGWGSYDGLLAVLREMRDAGFAVCCDKRRWEVSG